MRSRVPAACVGVVALICVLLITLPPAAAAPPPVAAAVASKFVPLIVIAVPPLVGPEVGLTPVTVGGGGAMYMNWSAALVALDWPPAVTITSTGPATCAGVVALICVALTTLTLVAGVPPTVTVALASKFVPVIVIAVPPAIGPEVGLTPVTVGAGGGGATYVNWSAGLVALDWPFTVTITSATPAACAGVVALICVALTTVTPVASVPPTVTVAVASKPVPVIVIAVPPANGPEVGLTALMVGGAM